MHPIKSPIAFAATLELTGLHITMIDLTREDPVIYLTGENRVVITPEGRAFVQTGRLLTERGIINGPHRDALEPLLKDIAAAQAVWRELPGDVMSAPLSVWGDYVISHRPNHHIVSYRLSGQHQHVGEYKTPEAAKEAAITHFTNQ